MNKIIIPAIVVSACIIIIVGILAWVASSGYFDALSEAQNLQNQFGDRTLTTEECKQLAESSQKLRDAKNKMFNENKDLWHLLEGWLNPPMQEFWLYELEKCV